MYSSFSSSIFRSTASYALAARLKGHQDGVHSLAVSPDGRLLASGGGDGVRIWDLHTYQELKFLPQSHVSRGPITCVVWVACKDNSFARICYGTGLGYLVVYQVRPVIEELSSKRLATGREIICLTHSNGNLARIALGTQDRVVEVFKIDAKGELNVVFCVQLETTVPIAITFVDNTALDVLVFGLYDGKIHTLRGDNGKVLSTMDVGGFIGSAAVDHSRNQFIVDSVVNGFNLHQLDNGYWRLNYTTGKPSRKLPKQIAFGEESNIVVGGSDHGNIYVFDRRTGSPLHVLRHQERGLVQTITTHEGEDRNIIASASSANCGELSICVWIRKKHAPKLQGCNERKTGHDMLHLLMVLVMIIFLYQNLVSSRFGDVRDIQHVQDWATSRVAGMLTGKRDAAPLSHRRTRMASDMKQTTNKVSDLILSPQKRNKEDEETKLTRIVDGIMRSLIAEKWRRDNTEANTRKAKNVVYL